MDDLDAAAQPRCDVCSTVLHHIPHGFRCVSCGLDYLPTFTNDETPRLNPVKGQDGA